LGCGQVGAENDALSVGAAPVSSAEPLHLIMRRKMIKLLIFCVLLAILGMGFATNFTDEEN